MVRYVVTAVEPDGGAIRQRQDWLGWRALVNSLATELGYDRLMLVTWPNSGQALATFNP